MKKLGFLFVSVIMIMLFAISASAKTIVDSGECGANGDNVTWVLYDDGELILSGYGDIQDFHLYDSTKFSPWDKFLSQIVNVDISDGITSIGNRTFRDCESLKSIIIPDSITRIGEDAFYNCVKLKSIIIPENVVSIDDRAFYNCTNLIDIAIPDSVKEIGSSAFNIYSDMNISLDSRIFCTSASYAM